MFIESYGKDIQILLEFTRSVGKPRIEDITLEDIKLYYKAVIDPMDSRFYREETMKKVRKFFREHRSKKCLRASEIRDNPFDCVVKSAIMEPMKKEIEKKMGRPPNIEMIRKVKVMREDLKLSFRKIGAAVGKDSKQAFMWYEASKTL